MGYVHCGVKPQLCMPCHIRVVYCCVPCMSYVPLSHHRSVSRICAMGKRGRPHGGVGPSLAELGTHRITKSAMAHVFETLHAQGLLAKRVTRRNIQHAVAEHASVPTPWGPVVQPLEGCPPAECCPPAALMYYMCTISASFADCCKRAVDAAGDEPLRYIAYNDGVTPGNPFRPERGRKVETWYWVCTDWPTYLLHRSGMWPIFTLIRTNLVNAMPGGVSHVSKLMLRQFKPFEEGVLLPHKDGHFMMRMVFAGFIADLVAHKSILCARGVPSGVRPCWNCSNLTSRDVRGPTEVGYLHHDRSAWGAFTDHQLFAMVDRLHREALALGPSSLNRLCSEVGFNIEPSGLIMDAELRSIYAPCVHHHRDWMHVIVQDGVSNWETAMLLHQMKSCPANIDVSMVQRFMLQCVLPKQRGKPHPQWLNEARLKPSTVKSFASTMLSVISIVTMFLDHYVEVARHLPDHVRCYKLLYDIVWHLRVDAGIVDRVPILRTIIVEHHRLWGVLYPTIARPKLHHLQHVIDMVATLGKLVACFTCERKHRSVKRSAINVYRHFEHTTIVDMLNTMATELREHDIFAEQCLIRQPRVVTVGTDVIHTARSCLCHCGELHEYDIIVFITGHVGRATSFWVHPAATSHAVQFRLLRRHTAGVDVFIDTGRVMFSPLADVMDAVIHFPMTDGKIRVAMPPASVLP